MAKTIPVSEDKWRDAVKFLMNLGTGPTLTGKDQRLLRFAFRGPFANGMTQEAAHKFLTTGMRWEKRL